MIMLSVHKTQFKIILLLKITFCSLPGSSLSPLAPGLPCSASLSSYPPQRLAVTGQMVVPSLGWSETRTRLVTCWWCASSCPGLWREGRRASTLKKKNICTNNRLRLYKTIVLLKMSKGIPISWIFTRSENLCLLQGLFQKGKWNLAYEKSPFYPFSR